MLFTYFKTFFAILFLIINFPQKYFILVNRIVIVVFAALCYESLKFWFFFDPLLLAWQLIDCVQWTSLVCFGFDHMSLVFFLLTTFITPFCLVSGIDSVAYNLRYFLVLFILLEFCVLLSFTVLDLFAFYIFFEALLIPMYLLIGAWGSTARRSLAANYFFFFTLAGSLLMLIGIFALKVYCGSTTFFALLQDPLPSELQLAVWPLFFIPFAVKIPMFPFHIWLPEAHVEAPTSGSMFLAAILLKLGVYGFVRILLMLLPVGSVYYQPVIFTLAVLGVFYTSFIALRQLDLKRVVAYSSIAHMNYALLGLFSFTATGFIGSMIIFVGHGFVSAGLFFLVGVLYDRYKTRLIFYYSGLVQRMPLFTIFFFFFSLANIAFPGTVNFFGELAVLLGLGKINFYLLVLAAFSLFFSVAFTFWVYNRISFGTVRTLVINHYIDLNFVEFGVLLFLLAPTVCFGFYPAVLYNFFEEYLILLNSLMLRSFIW